MNSPRHMPSRSGRITQQRGVSLFFALICLVAIMLAAVALVRSVDTSTLISGNLAFQQAATSSSDAGTEAAITWLAGVEAANTAKNVLIDPTHPFNVDDGANGYYSSLDSAKSLTASTGTRFVWDNTDSKLVGTDGSGNTTRYIVQRMCRTPGVAVKDADCLYSGAILDTNGQNIKLPQEVCKGAGCPAAGQTPQVRITSRTVGPKNTLSYVQAFVY
jgi:type IV pilus assembly protein PilX